MKRITQQNGAFVKFTYNDTFAKSENDTQIGKVTVADSKGVTDTWYYKDGITVASSLDNYSDEATYDPNNISNALTEDTVANAAYALKFDADESEDATEDESGETETEPTEPDVNEPQQDEYPLYEKDDDGNYTFYKYDENHNIIEQLEIKSGTLEVTAETTFENALAVCESKEVYGYTDGDQTSQIILQRIYGALRQTYSEETIYNACGLTTKEVKSKTTYSLDENNLVVDDTINSTVDYEYDCWNQCIKTIEDAGTEKEKVKTVSFDVLGNSTEINELDQKLSYEYDENRLRKATLNNLSTSYVYDTENNLTERHDANGQTAKYFYDEFGNLTYHTYNGYSFTYNTMGSILTMATRFDADGKEHYQRVEYTYSQDTKQEILKSSFGNGQEIVYTHDDKGNISSVKVNGADKYTSSISTLSGGDSEPVDEIRTLKDYMNNTRKMLRENQTNMYDLTTGRLLYALDKKSFDEEAESYKGVTVYESGDTYYRTTKGNEDAFRVQVSADPDFIKSYEYSDFDENIVSKVKTGNAYITNYDYYLNNLVYHLQNSLNSETQSYGYTYDQNGNIKTETVTTTSKGELGETVQTTESTEYTYDSKNQLTVAENDTTKWTYSYDNRGNILSKKDFDISVDESGNKVYTEKASDSYGYSDGWLDELTSYNGQSIVYDAVGNPINYFGHNLSWEYGRQLARYDDIVYTYNENGIRVSKTSNGVKTKYYTDDNGNIVWQSNGTDNLLFYYDRNEEVIGFKYNGSNYFYVKNQQGDITDITDSDGNVIASYTYDPWGKITSVSGSNLELANLNPFRYRSYYYDSETNLYYLQSRYYDPTVCRFINCDNVNYIGTNDTDISYNPFAYCENEPVNHEDPNGTWIETVLDAASVGWSLYDFIKRPSWMNFGFLVWDIAAACIPFAPGSYTAKGGKLVVNVASKIDDLKKTKSLTTGTYKSLKKLFKGIKGVEIHHIIEKRFKTLFKKCADPNLFMSIPLDKSLHKTITQRWRKEFKYGYKYSEITYSQMKKAICNVYRDMPALKKVALDWFKKNWMK